ncbi:MAG TPA: zinc-binding dehydrogenase, partial [Dehalococcoidia bacterium]|nr:zinc-binding dehydrogenase [Dehalococcoidia bacterium]
HEIVGRIETVGEAVAAAPGQRVAVCPIIACGHCYYCLRGSRNRCLARKTMGYDEDGGMSEYALVPASVVGLGHVFPLPPDLPAALATLMEPAACVLNSLETCRVKAGSSLVILGAGPMGLLHLLMARALGAAAVIASELEPARRGLARRFGATAAVDPRRDDLRAVVLDATQGLGADAVVVTTGSTELLAAALALVRRQGVINLFAGFPPDSRTELDPNHLHYDEINLTGSQNATPEQYRRALLLLGVMPQAAQINTHAFPIAEAPKAYESRLGMDGLKSLVIF